MIHLFPPKPPVIQGFRCVTLSAVEGIARIANETVDLAFTKSVSASRIEGSANIPIYPAHQNKKRGVSWQS